MSIIPQLKAGASLSQVIGAMAQQLRFADVETPWIDARILLGYALRLTRAQLLTQSDRLLEQHEIDAVSALLTRRLKREPVSRILGYREFWNLTLQITPDVLDPRPETETLVEAALDFITHSGNRKPLKILDIGTGSGAIILALLRELPEAIGTATDLNPHTIEVARANAKRHGLYDRCHFVVSDIAMGLADEFDLIVSNPPYVAGSEIMTLEPEVRDYDPAIALDGGADGLDAYRAIAQHAGGLLAAHGRLFVEFGADQEMMVGQILARAGWVVGPARADLAGIPRVLGAAWTPQPLTS